MVRVTYTPLTVYCMRPAGYRRYRQKEACQILVLAGLPYDLAALCAAFAANLPPLPFVSNWDLWCYSEPEYDQSGNYAWLSGNCNASEGNQIYHGF